MNTPEQSLLGKPAIFSVSYDPTLLYPIPRAAQRSAIGITGSLPFLGADLWTAYELSWLTPRGKPQVAIAHFTVPCESTHIVESKSLKLYLSSFSSTRFPTPDAVRERLREDLTRSVWLDSPFQSSVGVRLVLPDAFEREMVRELEGLSLDRLDIECSEYTPAPHLLRVTVGEQPVSEVLTSQLLKSNCLVTGQPDWGSVQIRYTGPQIEQGGLLQYLVSFREHNEFHEHCVERIYMDIWRECRPTRLSVHARYTRRGGIDINPFRASHPAALPPDVRTARQ